MADFLPTAHRIDAPGWLPLFGNWSACGDHRTASRTADVEPCIQSNRRDGADCQRGGTALRGNGETAGEYGAVQHRPDLSDDGAETEPYQPAQRAGGSCRVSNQQRENRKIAGVGGRDLRQAGCPDSCRGHAPQ